MSLRPVKIASITSSIVWNIENQFFPIHRKSVVRAQPIYINSEEKECALAKKKKRNFWWSNQKSLSDFMSDIFMCSIVKKLKCKIQAVYIHGWREKSIREVKSMRPVSMENKLRATARHSRSSSVVCFSHDVIAAEPRFTADLFFLDIPYTYSIRSTGLPGVVLLLCCFLFRLPTERLMSQTKSKTIILSWSWEDYAVLAGWAAVYVTLVEFRE